MTEKRQGGVQCIARTIKILEFIAERGKVGSTEISRELELHVATVHNILCELVNNYYLVNINGQYVIGPGVCALLSHYNPQSSLPEIIKPYLQRLAETTTETASGTILVGDKAHLIGFEQSRNSIGVIYPCWVWDNPLRLATASMLISQTFSPPRRQDLYGRLKLNKAEITATEKTLEAIARDRYYIKIDAGDGQQVAIGLCVYTKGDTPVAAIGISIPAFRATRSVVINGLLELIAASKALSMLLGGGDMYTHLDLDNLVIPENILEK